MPRRASLGLEVGNDSMLAMLDTNGDGIVDDNELLGGAAAVFDPGLSVSLLPDNNMI